jgi:predicted nucleic acid-binding protein
MCIFFDSSAFAKRYVAEEGRDAVVQWCDRAAEIALSGIALPELISAFCRLRRESNISEAQYQQLKDSLLADIEDAAICDLTPIVLAHSIASLERNTLRGMDAIHIGSAVAMQADLFVSGDARQCAAAAAVGLEVAAV